MFSRDSLTSWEEGVFFVLVGYPSSDSVTTKITYVVDVTWCLASYPMILLLDQLYWLREMNADSAVISTDAYPFLTFSEHTCHLEDARIDIFWLHCVY